MFVDGSNARYLHIILDESGIVLHQQILRVHAHQILTTPTPQGAIMEHSTGDAHFTSIWMHQNLGMEDTTQSDREGKGEEHEEVRVSVTLQPSLAILSH